ncbi:MAG TPA: bifunctional hydroxymethylpyrimidine kinase/phosphomethylpyrimidine kinase [Acidimicrobiales bacterium]|nr:bifunctional hydroxymethylpyrimidine kinase/phosphomethylpyrimidine kinase [Acidimicrobiales bacterium]
MTNPKPPVALTIAGSDSGGGAGIQADLKTFEAFGVWGTSALTGVTAQNTLGVRDSLVLPARLVRSQIDAVVDDIGISAAKTGMLGTAEVIVAVAEAAADGLFPWLVVDPVLVTSHGDLLLEEGAVKIVLDELVPLCSLLTPNIPEAEALLGHPVEGTDGMAEAAQELLAAGAPAVLLKGGHLGSDESPDVLCTPGALEWMPGARVAGRHTHGTGCTLSAAICAGLAVGRPLSEACATAKDFVTDAIRAGVEIGSGVGPVNPGWNNGRDQP